MRRPRAKLRAVLCIHNPGPDARRHPLASAQAPSDDRYFETLLAHLPLIVFEAGLDGRIRFLNDAWERLSGLPAAPLIGRPATALVRPEDAARLEGQLDAARRTRTVQASATVGLAVPRPGRVYRVRVGPAPSGDGILGLLADVTDHERRETVFRQGERLASLGTLLATAAHELNNPLAAISGFSQLLLGTAQDDETREALEMIHHEATRAARTVRDLLGFARARQGERRTPVDLNAIIAHTVSTRRYALETRGVACTTSLDATLPRVLAERSQMEQLIVALVINAEQALMPLTDAAPPVGPRPALRLALRTWSAGGRAYVEVADTGHGIPPDELPDIWKPFWTTKPDGEGTGLGLAIAHGIVEGHGGAIEVASVEGEGTRFTIGLPACDAPVPDESAAGRSARPLDVLLVGRPGALDFLRRYLTSRGHAVLAAPTPQRAQRLVSQVPVDVVLCEVRRSEAAAVELGRRLRAPGDHAPPRIIFALDESASRAARQRLRDAGAIVLTTPYEIERVRTAIEG